MVVRCSKKALDLIGSAGGPLSTAAPADTDWYLNLLWIDRRKCLLLVHAETLFAVIVPDVRKADLRPFDTFATNTITSALTEEDLPAATFGQLDPANVRVAKTASRSVLRFMTVMAFHAHYLIDADGGLEHGDIAAINRHLHRTPYNRGEYIWPIEQAGGTLDLRTAPPAQPG